MGSNQKSYREIKIAFNYGNKKVGYIEIVEIDDIL
ncbi:hypothetical protein MettiDRAFT_0749 [Methanolobus tindarius DSM 2278]|uniref:Uncharacterized protein n=1 Tax=Methanolobus tindarius DSM 2278 TaxID=1090322 RepID=W9DN20_METTI|nr:hypothetical protein MettiDRAFT_0749 [Methanolobus tindarius DSM 2278]